MKKILLTISMVFLTLAAVAQSVSVTWTLSDKDNLGLAQVTGDNAYLSDSFTLGSNIGATATMTGTNADSGYEAVSYDPYFTTFTPKTRVTGKTAGHCIQMTVTPQTGHSFKPTSISFDAAKVGTDGGNVDVYYQLGTASNVGLATALSPLRNKITSSNSTGFSHYEYSLGDVIVKGQSFSLYLYIYNLNGTDTENPKAIGFRNVNITGKMDEQVFDVSHYLSAFTCNGQTSADAAHSIDLYDVTKNLKNGGLASYTTKLYGDPTDFEAVCNDGYTATVDYSGHVATVKIYSGSEQVFYFETMFTVTNRQPKPASTPLKRGLMAVSLKGAGMGSGNLVSWRHREADGYGVKYKLYYGTSANPTLKLNSGKYITDKTNFLHTTGTTNHRYKLEVYDKYGNLLETEISEKAWENQTKNVTLAAAPVDLRNGATYTPNDASFCDMDGDGEYEIILKWRPSNEKDAASSGTTSQAVYDCYKLDGTQLWRIQTGYNMFNSAHTTPFIAWDFDGDGYGEFMCKTAPGAIDGEGNYVIMDGDDPNANWLNSRGKQVSGPEYITVFDGRTGAEISTIPYHTAYGDVSTSIWGDSDQNRSERYLAAIAWLDGPDKNPSPIFARGYYSGAFVAAYDFDGVQLKERWVSRNTSSGKGLWGEGAHSITVGDCDGDGKQEIVYGSAALDHDGSLLYRTGLGHGDALHLSDFVPEHAGQEVFMVHEKKPYGYDLRDAKTGERLLYKTASGDTGRGLAAHFDSSSPHSQFIYSAAAGMYDCLDGSEIASSWAIGNSGAGINCRIYWDGDLYDEFFDKSIIAHWNPTGKAFDRYTFNGGNYLWGELNNGSKNNPCVMGDLLGDWREEIVTWSNTDMDKTKDSNGYPIYTCRGNFYLCICATSFTSDYRIPHLMDDPDYRAQVILQNSVYNQPPHLSCDPSVKYAGNPNQAQQEDLDPEDEPEPLPEFTWTEQFRIDFEDEDYSMFTFDNAANITQSITTEANGTKSYDIYAERTRTVSLNLSDVDLGSYDAYKFEFDWGTGGSNMEASTLTVRADSVDQPLLTITVPEGYATITFNAGEQTLATYDNGRPLSVPNSLFHIQFVGIDNGLYLTITKDGVTYVDNVKVCDTPARITGITELLGRAYNHTVFDNILFSTYQTPEPQPEIVWTSKLNIDFEDEDYSMFTFDNAANITQSITTEANGTKSYDIYAERTRTVSLPLANLDLGSYDLYTFEFDWGTGGSNTEASTLIVHGDSVDQLLTVNIPEGYATITFVAGGDTLGSGYNGRPLSVPNALFHFQFVGSEAGVYLTITRGDETYVDSVKICPTMDKVTGITNKLGRSYNHTVFDNIQYKVRAVETPDIPEPQPVLGDVDGDGFVTVSDITLLISIYLGEESEVYIPGSGDLDSDQRITVTDITLLIDIYLAGEQQ